MFALSLDHSEGSNQANTHTGNRETLRLLSPTTWPTGASSWHRRQILQLWHFHPYSYFHLTTSWKQPIHFQHIYFPETHKQSYTDCSYVSESCVLIPFCFSRSANKTSKSTNALGYAFPGFLRKQTMRSVSTNPNCLWMIILHSFSSSVSLASSE